MNAKMIQFLVRKDWYLGRWLILMYSIFAAASVGIASIRITEAFYLGGLLIITTLISLGIHLTMSFVLAERTNKNLAFVLSLPLTPGEYSVAKCISVLSMYSVPWMIVMVGTWISVLTHPGIPTGTIPFFTIVLINLLAGACLLFAVALVTESTGLTIATVVFNNIALNVLMPYLSNSPHFKPLMAIDSIQWDILSLSLIAVQIALIPLLFLLAMILQGRKREFAI